MFDRSGSDYKDVPPHLLDALDAFGREARPVGDFLTAVLENDLCKTFAHADTENRPHIGALIKYVYNQLPGECWGSKEKVVAWERAFTKNRNGGGAGK